MHNRLKVIGRVSAEVLGVIAIFGLSDEFKPCIFHKVSKADVARVKDAAQLLELQLGSRLHELKLCDQQLKSSLFEKIRKTSGDRHISCSELDEIIKNINKKDQSTTLLIESLKRELFVPVDGVMEILDEYRVVQSWDMKELTAFNQQIEFDKPADERYEPLVNEWRDKRLQLLKYFKSLNVCTKLQTELLQEELESSPDNYKDEMLISALRVVGSLSWLAFTRNVLFAPFPQRTLLISARPLIFAFLGLATFKLTILASMLNSLSLTHLALRMIGAGELVEDDINVVEEDNTSEEEREAKKATLDLTKELIAFPELRQRWLGSSYDDPYTMERRFIYNTIPVTEYSLVLYFGLMRSLLGLVSPIAAHVITAWAYAMIEEDRITPQRAQAGLPILESMTSNASFSLVMQLFVHLLIRPRTMVLYPAHYLMTMLVLDLFRPKDAFIDPFDYIQEDTPRFEECIKQAVKNMTLFAKWFPNERWSVVHEEQWRRLRTAVSSDIGGDATVKKLRAKDLFDLFCAHHSLVLKNQQQQWKERSVLWVFVSFTKKLPELQFDDELLEKVLLSYYFETFQRYLDIPRNENREVSEKEFRNFVALLLVSFNFGRNPREFDALIAAVDTRNELTEEQGLDLVNDYFQAAVDEDEYVLGKYEPNLFEDTWRQRLAGRLPVAPPARQTLEAFARSESGKMIFEMRRRFTVGGSRCERRFMLEHGVSPQKLKSIANQLSMKYRTIQPLEDEWVAYFQSTAQGERLLAKIVERDDEPYKKAVYERLNFTKQRPHKDKKLT